ncbi:MAG: RNA polymerase sigma factor [Deltaproteobacteria bacterium]|nr:RNA polymerase sigma factor [Deltaproteobacteria bacterium]
MSSDRETLLRLRERDTAAFDAVFEAHRAGLFRFLVRMCGEVSAAEDLFQETWLRFAREAPRLSLDTPVGPWLFRVARNLSVSRHRRASVFARVNTWASSPSAPPSPLDGAAGSELLARLEAALLALRPRDREVILLVMVEGLSPKDAGIVLGLGAEATRQRLSRARKALRAELAEFMEA